MFYVILLAILIPLVLNSILTPLIIRLSWKRGWFDRVDQRKIHTEETPRLGGVGIFLSFMLSAFFLAIVSRFYGPFQSTPVFTSSIVFIFLGFASMHLIGLVDDFKNIPAWLKLVGQIASAALIALGGVSIPGFELPFIHSLVPFGFLGSLLTVFWLISISNAVNLIDGLDGLAGGTSAISAFFLGLIHVIFNNPTGAVISFLLVGSLLGFLLFNRPKAAIFMGDSGSLLLGFILGSLAFIQPPRAMIPGSLIISITLLFVPITDMVSAILRRIRKRVPIHSPDREHLHHKLLDFGLSAKQILSIIYPLTAFAGLGGILWAVSRTSTTFPAWAGDISLLFVWLVIACLFLVLHYKNKRRKNSL